MVGELRAVVRSWTVLDGELKAAWADENWEQVLP